MFALNANESKIYIFPDLNIRRMKKCSSINFTLNLSNDFPKYAPPFRCDAVHVCVLRVCIRKGCLCLSLRLRRCVCVWKWRICNYFLIVSVHWITDSAFMCLACVAYLLSIRSIYSWFRDSNYMPKCRFILHEVQLWSTSTQCRHMHKHTYLDLSWQSVRAYVGIWSILSL